MNYEEMLKSQESASSRREKLPFGYLCKKQVDNKFRNVIELKPMLADSLVFGDAIKKDQAWSAAHPSQQQLQFTVNADKNVTRELELESGTFTTLAQMLVNDPAIVASRGFIDHTVSTLLDYAATLHADGVFQLCFAPQNILVKKGSSAPLLLCHGSFYTSVSDVKGIYEDVVDYMAPEVMSRSSVDERSDIYSLGKLIEYLYDTASVPFEYKKLVKKATAANPDDRYKSIDELKQELTAKRAMRRSAFVLVAAVVLALLGVWAFMEIVPQTEYVEFVEPVVDEGSSNPLDDNYDPELDPLLGDDTIPLSDTDRIYQAKAEEIYRRRFEEAAEKTLSEIYDKRGARGRTDIASSQALMDQLMEKKAELAQQSGIDDDKAEAIAQEIIARIEEEKVVSKNR